jgi:hypothetical protein
MEDSRFSFEEFKALFADDFESQEELRRQYDSFLSVLSELDRVPVPPFSSQQKAEIFQQAWRKQATGKPPVRAWLAQFVRVAAIFALGTAFGCASMFVAMKGHPAAPQPIAGEPSKPASPESPLKVQYTQEGQIYTGEAIQELYPQIENPKMVVEQPPDKAEPRRVLYGTLAQGEITVVWNL